MSEPAVVAPLRRRGRRRGRVVRRVLAGLVVLAVGVFGVTAVRVWQVGRQDHRPHADVLLVLGAAQYDGTPSATLAARLDHALTLWHDGVAPRIVTVGGKQVGDRFTEAQSGVDYLAAHGVPAPDLVAVPIGSDTLLSLRAAAPVLARNRWHTAVLVTDPWHELRSRTMADDLGIDATTSPTRSGPASHGRATQARYIARESLGYLYYRAFHRP